ncbi:MAG: alkaline phosphatase D family protein [Rhodospirillaceae bacterium]
MTSEKAEPQPIVGPILYFRGVGKLGEGGRGEGTDRWRLSVLFVFDGVVEPDDLVVEGVSLPIPPRHVFVWRNKHVWRFVFQVPRAPRDREISYGFPERGRLWRMTVPGQSTRLRLAYTSSNGIHDEFSTSRLPGGAEGLWTQLLMSHAEHPYHILVQGGNQIHADNLWKECSAFNNWWAHPEPERWTRAFTRTMADQAMDYYFNAYCTTMAKPDYARAMASIPSVMMWDDHDIFDGWGSRPDAEHQSQVYRGLFAVVRRQFSLFQLGAAIRDPLECVWGSGIGTFSQGFRIGDIGLLALDLRSERTRTKVLGDASWHELPGWLSRFKGCKHLLISTAVPVGFVGAGWLEKMAATFMPGSPINDDLRDQWRSSNHYNEWQRLLHLLAEYCVRTRCRITILSGETHLGAAAIIRGCGAEMWQLVSSGVTHAPLGALNTTLLRGLVRSPERVSEDFTLEFPRFAENNQRFIRARNFLSVGFDRQNHLLARWHSEGNPDHYNLVI